MLRRLLIKSSPRTAAAFALLEDSSFVENPKELFVVDEATVPELEGFLELPNNPHPFRDVGCALVDAPDELALLTEDRRDPSLVSSRSFRCLR